MLVYVSIGSVAHTSVGSVVHISVGSVVHISVGSVVQVSFTSGPASGTGEPLSVDIDVSNTALVVTLLLNAPFELASLLTSSLYSLDVNRIPSSLYFLHNSSEEQ